MGISLDSPETLTKYIGALHSYVRHSLLLFEPTTIDMASVKAIHLESKRNNEKEYHPKKSCFKPHNGKFKGKGKGKDKKETITKIEEGAKLSCTHCKNEGDDDEHSWKLLLELKSKIFGGNLIQMDIGGHPPILLRPPPLSLLVFQFP